MTTTRLKISYKLLTNLIFIHLLFIYALTAQETNTVDTAIEASLISVSEQSTKARTRVRVFSPKSGATVSNVFTIKGNAPRWYKYVAVQVDGVWQGQSSPRRFSITTKSISNGTHTVKVYAKKKNGNWDNGVEFKVHVGTQTPTEEIVTPPNVTPPNVTPPSVTPPNVTTPIETTNGEKRFAPDIFSDSFSSASWAGKYQVGNNNYVSYQKSGGYNGSGGLRIHVKTGEHYGAWIKRSVNNRKAVYAQYKVYYEDSFKDYVGKSPGWDGSRGPGGFGGNPSTGYNGWSARGSINDIDGTKVRNKYYVYHVDQEKTWGDSHYWTPNQANTAGPGDFNSKRWYTVDMYIKVNTPGQRNGILRAWVDGKKVFERKNYMFTKTANNDYDKVDNFWINYYYGGKETSPSNSYVRIDDFRLSSRLITLGSANDSKSQSSYGLTDVKAYPNPTNDILNLDFSANHQVNEVQIVDLTGRLVLQKSIKKGDKTASLKLNNGSMAKGIYILKVIKNDSFEVMKIVKK